MKLVSLILITIMGISQAAAKFLRHRQLNTLLYQGNCNDHADAFCHRYASCHDIEGTGTFECICNTGFEGDGRVCRDLNECVDLPNFPCPSVGGVCVDTDVMDSNPDIARYQGYKCICDSRSGFIDGPESDVHGPTSCIDPTIPTVPPTPAPTHAPTASLAPTERNELTCESDDDCHRFASCIQGQCLCNTGYEGDGFFVCEDFNECAQQGDDFPCPPPSMGGFCVDTDVHSPQDSQYEGYRCGCNTLMGVVNGPEFNVHGPTSCVDVNECLDSDLNTCDENASCINTFGSFECQCFEGFNGDGFTCSENPTASPSTSPTFMMRCFGTDDEVVLYKENFVEGTAEGWSIDKVQGTNETFPDEFSEFLGPFAADDESPSLSLVIPASALQVLLTFDFYEIDAWNSTEDDSLGIIIEAPNEGVTTVINFGTFAYNVSETYRDGASTTDVDDDEGAYTWKIESTPISESPQGSLSEFPDQRHHVEVELGPSLYAIAGEEDLTITLDFSLSGDNKFIGFDNFKMAACVDTVPTMMPSLSLRPSESPSGFPSNAPTRMPVPPQPQPTTDIITISGGATEFPTLAGDDDSDPPPVVLLAPSDFANFFPLA